ncbi:jg7934 [Pararge aegeria aegeria]|uniref:Jg7934 protein n=1 Tax=Pararge aegeria aegeria TaxID=348720 RepID=A0A8S4SGI6_9NEOP|nr:jg7934 [Pararge aegeria aegeria]
MVCIPDIYLEGPKVLEGRHRIEKCSVEDNIKGIAGSLFTKMRQNLSVWKSLQIPMSSIGRPVGILMVMMSQSDSTTSVKIHRRYKEQRFEGHATNASYNAPLCIHQLEAKVLRFTPEIMPFKPEYSNASWQQK